MWLLIKSLSYGWHRAQDKGCSNQTMSVYFTFLFRDPWRFIIERDFSLKTNIASTCGLYGFWICTGLPSWCQRSNSQSSVSVNLYLYEFYILFVCVCVCVYVCMCVCRLDDNSNYSRYYFSDTICLAFWNNNVFWSWVQDIDFQTGLIAILGILLDCLSPHSVVGYFINVVILRSCCVDFI